MKSIFTKVLSVVLVIVVVLVGWIMFVSLSHIESLEKIDSETAMQYASEAKVREIDDKLTEIQLIADETYYYASQELESIYPQFLEDRDIRSDYSYKIERLMNSAVVNTKGILCAYYRFSPEYAGSTEGFFLNYDEENGIYESITPTDINKYDKDDIAHVGWYYEPLKAKHPIWMDTYTNENIGKEMISYVIPVYYKDRTIGILGMDIDVQYLRDEVSEVELYNTGYAFLVQVNDDILYHPKYPSGVRRKELSEDFVKLIAGIESEENLAKVVDATFKGERVRLVADRLANDMILCIVVPESEFTRELDEIVTDAAKLALPVAIIGILMIIIMLYRIVNPLRKLARISSNIEQGNFDSEFDFRMDRNDEVGVLARSFDSMSNSMKAHFEYMNNVAYLDELTGLGNRNAYMEKEDEFENQVIDGKASFTVVVMDVNNLKWVNDYSGHEMGDRMLMRIASLIRDEFGKDRCYRIGGDEFVALYPGIVEDISDKIAEFQTSVMEKSEHDYDEFKFHYNVACGYAIFDPEIDSSFTDVFRRADYMMYDDKERIKASNPVEY